MSPPPPDPFATLGVSPEISDQELRATYRRLVQRHHPDHNGGSAESARRFEEIQEAYARITSLRRGRPQGAHAGGAQPDPAHAADLETKIADLERELREAQQARERARRAAREAAQAAAERAARATAAAGGEPPPTRHNRRPTDEELGYIRTDDSFSKIIDDARSELTSRVAQAREHPAARRAGELIDELEELLAKLPGEPRRPRR